MRNPNRLENFYDELERIHRTHFCDWRFGQFMSNFFRWLYQEYVMDPFFPEEDKMLEYLYEFAGEKPEKGDP